MKEHNASVDTFLQSVFVVASGLSLKSHTWTGEASASQDHSCPAWFVNVVTGCWEEGVLLSDLPSAIRAVIIINI